MREIDMSPHHDRWAEVWVYLQRLVVMYNRDQPMPWRFAAPIVCGAPDYPARFQELETAVCSEVENAVRELLETGKTAPVSQAAQFWLGVRVDTCIVFASHLSTRDGFLTPSDVALDELARWLLLDWWKDHGATYATSLDWEWTHISDN